MMPPMMMGQMMNPMHMMNPQYFQAMMSQMSQMNSMHMMNNMMNPNARQQGGQRPYHNR